MPSVGAAGATGYSIGEGKRRWLRQEKEGWRKLCRRGPSSLMSLYLQVAEVHHAALVMETTGRQPQNEPDTHRQGAEDFLLKATVANFRSAAYTRRPTPPPTQPSIWLAAWRRSRVRSGAQAHTELNE